MVTNLEHLSYDGLTEALQRSRQFMTDFTLIYCEGCDLPFFTSRKNKRFCSKNCGSRVRFGGSKATNIKVDNSSLPFTVVEPTAPPKEKTAKERKMDNIRLLLENDKYRKYYGYRHKELITDDGPTTYLEFLKKVVAAPMPQIYPEQKISDKKVRDEYLNFDYHYYTELLGGDMTLDSDTLLEDCKES